MITQHNPLDKKIYVVIVTFNGERWIRECISSLLKLREKPEIIVIDNASQDNTISIINSEFKTVTLFSQAKNLGFGRANNIGIDYAIKDGADFVLLINQDARVHKDMLSSLLIIAQENRDYGLLSPIHWNYEGTCIDPKFQRYLLDSDPLIFSDFFIGKKKSIYSVRFVPAAIWLLKTEMILQVGTFDPVYFLYGEDDDLAKRIRLKCWKIGIVPGSIGYHYHSVVHNEGKFNEAQSFAEAVDILKFSGKPFLQAFFFVFRKFLADMISSLLMMDFYAFGLYIKNQFKVMRNIRKIWKSKKQIRLNTNESNTAK